jgi:uncharacterized protein
MSSLDFAPGVAEKIGFYVYVLIDPRDGAVFYVGKGIGNRCFAHIAEARATEKDSVDDYAKLAQIREIESFGRAVHIKILRHGLTDPEAFLVESAAIDLAALVQPGRLTTRVRGHDAVTTGLMSVDEINILYGATPVTIRSEHRVVLIRINRQFNVHLSESELYEATRKWWVVGSGRREAGSWQAPRWAMSVFGGVVRAVYRIDGWERPTAADIADGPKRQGRWAFFGARDPDMETLYLHRDVWAYLRDPVSGRASQSPLRYVHCEPVSGDEQTTDAQ